MKGLTTGWSCRTSEWRAKRSPWPSEQETQGRGRDERELRLLHRYSDALINKQQEDALYSVPDAMFTPITSGDLMNSKTRRAESSQGRDGVLEVPVCCSSSALDLSYLYSRRSAQTVWHRNPGSLSGFMVLCPGLGVLPFPRNVVPRRVATRAGETSGHGAVILLLDESGTSKRNCEISYLQGRWSCCSEPISRRAMTGRDTQSNRVA